MPERSPDIYYVELPLAPHTVTFATDLDSIAIPVTYGSRTQFVIRLGDGTDALTEVRAEFRDLLVAQTTRTQAAESPTIPFRLGDNDKIYVQGRINDSALLSFQLDFGAGGSILKKTSVPRVPIAFVDSITLSNSDATNRVPLSDTSQLTVGDVTWRGVAFAVAENLTRREDALIGNSLFRDKVVEIDYRSMLITIHDSMPELSAEWIRVDMVLDGGTVPFIPGALSIDGATQAGWYMLDTGAYTSILNSPRLSRASKFGAELKRLLAPLGMRPADPEIALAGHTLSGTNYSTRRYTGDPTNLGLLGNDVLKRFDLIIDNRQGAAYFRPNDNSAARYRNPERLVVRAAAAATLAIVGLIIARKLLRRR
jgi:hypothetical protein